MASLTLPLTGLRDKMPPFEVVRSRRGARVDESTCLESMRLGNGTVGSNPTLSAIESAKEDWEGVQVESPLPAEAVGFEQGGIAGEGLPCVGRHEGAGPLSGSAYA